MSKQYDVISEVTMGALERYSKHHIPTGGFLKAVFENKLMDAVSRADEENMRCLREICIYIYNEMPSACWGSEQKVKEWLAVKNPAWLEDNEM